MFPFLSCAFILDYKTIWILMTIDLLRNMYDFPKCPYVHTMCNVFLMRRYFPIFSKKKLEFIESSQNNGNRENAHAV